MRACWMLALTVLSTTPMALANPQPKPAAVQALYPTKAEAERAAPRFGCSGAHAMGDQWMPCSKHGASGGASHGSH